MSLRALSLRAKQLANLSSGLAGRPIISSSSWQSTNTRSIIKGNDDCFWRCFSTVEAAQSQIDEVNDMFAEARDIIEDARDDAETVYFNDAHAEAKEAVGNCLDKFNGILGSLSPDEKGKLQRSMGLKIEQLKAELEELDQLHA